MKASHYIAGLLVVGMIGGVIYGLLQHSEPPMPAAPAAFYSAAADDRAGIVALKYDVDPGTMRALITDYRKELSPANPYLSSSPANAVPTIVSLSHKYGLPQNMIAAMLIDLHTLSMQKYFSEEPVSGDSFNPRD